MSETPRPPLQPRSHEAIATTSLLEKPKASGGPTPKESLLVWQQRQTLLDAIRNNPTVILAAGTGTGKTRAGSQICLEAIGPSGKMIVTENLRKATDDSAKIVASDMGVKVGEEVGVQNKYRHQTSEKTRLLFCPVQSLLIKMADPLNKDLPEYNLIAMDEVHKESKQNELCMIALREIQARRQKGNPQGLPELKLVFISATADKDKIMKHFSGAKTVEMPGTTYDVDEIFEDKPVPVKALPLVAAEKVRSAISKNDPGNILVFLSGRAQIDQAAKSLHGMDLKDTVIVPYYGSMSKADQERTFAEYGNKRKVILATNAAQESLTLTINTVIDTCMHKHQEFDKLTGRSFLVEKSAPFDHLMQRRGRVGRNPPESGAKDKYYALITKDEWKRRKQYEEHEPAEMQRTDLTSAVLLLLANQKDPYSFPYINPPDRSHIDIALERLSKIGAVQGGVLTEKGKFMASLSINPNLGSMVGSAIKYGSVNQACKLAAMLEEYPDALNARGNKSVEKILSRYKTSGSDFMGLIAFFDDYEQVPPGQRKKWLEERGHGVQKMRDVFDLYNELTDATKDKIRVSASALLPQEALDASIREGFADSLVTNINKDTYHLINMQGSTRIEIDKQSALASRPPHTFVFASVNPYFEGDHITKRLATLNHPLKEEIKPQSSMTTSSTLPDELQQSSPTPPSSVQTPEKPSPPPKPPNIWKRFTNWFSNTWLGKWLRS